LKKKVWGPSYLQQ